MTKLDDLYLRAKELVEEKPFLRLGQALYNLADEEYKEYTRDINGNPSIDPFYNDDNISIFLNGLNSFINESE